MDATESVPMRIGALSPWFGSKRNLAPTIVQELGLHRVYWEPCCGSMAVVLAKEPCVMETVNDKHGQLINLALVLKDEDLAIDLYGRAARIVFHEDLFDQAVARLKIWDEPSEDDPPDVGRAEDFLVASWFGRNGVAGTRSYNQGFCVRYTANGGHSATRWRGVIESIPAWHQRLRNVTILNRDLFDLLGRISDEERTAIYVDPPYLVKGSKYIHDFSPEDHVRLAESLRRFTRARVVVSYYAHPLLAELYPGWRMREIEVTKSLVNQGLRDKGGATKATEVLLVNDGRKDRDPGLFGQEDP